MDRCAERWTKVQTTHLCALWILQALLEEGDDGVGLEVEDEVGAAGEDAEGGLAREDVGVFSHREHLRLEGGPGMAALHGVVGQVRDGVHGLSPDDGGGLMEERVEEDALEGLYGLGAELVIDGEPLGGGRAEEETAEEDEREGAHLGWRVRTDRRPVRGVLTSSVSADVANGAIASRYSSGVCASLSSTACSALHVGRG